MNQSTHTARIEASDDSRFPPDERERLQLLICNVLDNPDCMGDI